MQVIVTICSKHKRENSALLSARDRYTGEHIKKTDEIAKGLGVPFFILSGKYGLLPAEKKIPNYDYRLDMDAVDTLTKVVTAQLKGFDISEVDFYKENKESWIPYETVLGNAANLAGVAFRVYQL